MMAGRDRIDEPFRTWVWKQWSFLITSLVGLITLYVSWTREYQSAKPTVDWLGSHIDLVIFLAQSGVAGFLFARLMFGPTSLACPSVNDRGVREREDEPRGRRGRINKALERFLLAWRWVWATWTLLYFALAIAPKFGPKQAQLSLDVHSLPADLPVRTHTTPLNLNAALHSIDFAARLRAKSAVRETLLTADRRLVTTESQPREGAGSHLPLFLYHALLNFINNINGLAFLALYEVMTRRVRRQDRANRPSVILFFGIVTVLLLGWELVWGRSALPGAVNYFDVIGAAFAAGVLILFFGRLAGQYIRPHGAIPPLLATYCLIQMAWPYFPTSTLIAATVATYALFMKIMLFYVVDYSLRSGDLIYYFDRFGDRTAPVVANGRPDAWPELGQIQKRRQIERLLSDSHVLDPWGTDREEVR